MTIPDFPKDVSGHDAQVGEQDEPDEDHDPVAADGIDDQNIVSLIVMLSKVELAKSFVKSQNHFRSKANLNLPLLSKRRSCDSPVNL